jgi:hypothetical protein
LLRSHFKHSVELVDDDGEIVDQLAGVQDFVLAKATYDAAVRRWSKSRIRLCQEARIVEDHDQTSYFQLYRAVVGSVNLLLRRDD